MKPPRKICSWYVLLHVAIIVKYFVCDEESLIGLLDAYNKHKGHQIMALFV